MSSDRGSPRRLPSCRQRHGATTTLDHSHSHSDHAGGQHSDSHAHAGANHAPGPEHIHDAAASVRLRDPVRAGIGERARLRGGAVAAMTDDQLFTALFGSE